MQSQLNQLKAEATQQLEDEVPDLRGNNYRKALIGHVAKFSQDYCSRHPVRLLPENDHNKVVNRQTLETVQNQIDEGLRPGQLDNSVLYSNLATEIRQPRETHKPVSRTTRNNIRQLYFNSSQHAGENQLQADDKANQIQQYRVDFIKTP